MSDPSLIRDVLLAGISGVVTGLITWGRMSTDIKWIKAAVLRLENAVFFDPTKTHQHQRCDDK